MGSLGFSGPCLKASGVKWDLRKSQPYEVYDKLEFDIPVGKTGDCYARYLVRMEEMRQSLKLIKQVINEIPNGDYITEDKKIAPPKKKKKKKNPPKKKKKKKKKKS